MLLWLVKINSDLWAHRVILWALGKVCLSVLRRVQQSIWKREMKLWNYFQMSFQVVTSSKSFVALFTDKWFFSSVYSHVFSQLLSCVKLFSTVRTLMGKIVQVT